MFKAQTESPKSFRDAFMKAFGEEGSDEECSGELLDEDLPEKKWYKSTQEEPNTGGRSASPRPVIHVSDEELQALSKPWRNNVGLEATSLLGEEWYNKNHKLS